MSKDRGTNGFRSWCLTIRPLHGIADQTVEALQKWLNGLEYAVAVLEMDGESRHMHAQIWSHSGKRKGDVAKALQRICERTIKDWSDAQKKVLRDGIKVGYTDWYLDYLTENDAKDDPNILIYKPPDLTMDFYPTEEEQEQVKNLANAVDPRFTQMEQRFHDWYPHDLEEHSITIQHVAQFIMNEMFNARNMRVIVQKKDRIALVKSLFLFITKSDDISECLPADSEEKNLIKNLEKINL